jgi:hypothetical protein
MKGWIEKAIKPPLRSQSTYEAYLRILDKRILPFLGSLRLQSVTPLDLDAYYGSLKRLAPATIQVHHAVIHGALNAALKAGIVTRNVATLVTAKPKMDSRQDVLDHVWTCEEAALFLATAKKAGAQPAAFYSLALDTGARRGRTRGAAVDRSRFRRRKADNSAHAAQRRHQAGIWTDEDENSAHRRASGRNHQAAPRPQSAPAEIKLRNRKHYPDGGLMFAKEWGDLPR